MNEVKIGNIAEFHKRLDQLHDKESFIYRGQSNAEWAVDCSAARRLKRNHTDKVKEQLINFLLIGYLDFLIEKAKMRGVLPSEINEKSSDLEIAAQLQHQGAATGLIDFTRHPLVALWFACNEPNEDDGVVYALSDTKTKKIDTLEKLKMDTRSFYTDDELWSWEPSTHGNRIVAQSSVLVFGHPYVPLTEMKKFIIKARSKKGMLTQLETIYGINEESLFSDFSGYAVANSSNKDTDPHRAINYWRKKTESALDNYQKAEAYFSCGLAYIAIMDNKKSIEQLDRAIAYNPQYAVAYSIRGAIKKHMNDQTFKQDFEQANLWASIEGNSDLAKTAQKELDKLQN